MSNPHHVVPEFGRARPGFADPPTLFIGPSRFGTLEVLVSMQPPDDVFVFHAMALRLSTVVEARYGGDDA